MQNQISFDTLNVQPNILKAIQELGITSLTPIQEKSIPLLLDNNTDFMGLAATGTGKTFAFGIPLLNQINTKKNVTQALIMCPTRELALQVQSSLDSLCKYTDIRTLCIYGGAGYGDQISGLKRGAHIVIATPGRLVDFLERGTLKTDAIHNVILDEADEMISMGFKEDLEYILDKVPNDNRKLWFFSATMDKQVRKLSEDYLRNPKMAEINRSQMLSGTVEQLYYKVRESDKFDILCKIIDVNEDFYGIVFCQTKAAVQDFTDQLKLKGYPADCIHGDMDQKAREKTLSRFKEKKSTILICTDVAARGLDVKGVTHVINHSIPRELENYVHRIGRTGRSGKTGIAISLVTPTHFGLLAKIEKLTSVRVKEGKIPTRKDIVKQKLNRFFANITAIEETTKAMTLIDESTSNESLLQLLELSPKELLARFMTQTYADILIDRNDEVSNNDFVGASFGGGRGNGRGRDRDDRGGRSFGDRDGGGRGRSFGGGDRGGRGGDRGGRSFGGGRDRDDRGGRSFGGDRDRAPRSFSDRAPPLFTNNDRGAEKVKPLSSPSTASNIVIKPVIVSAEGGNTVSKIMNTDTRSASRAEGTQGNRESKFTAARDRDYKASSNGGKKDYKPSSFKGGMNIKVSRKDAAPMGGNSAPKKSRIKRWGE